jgi:hypothetical protein
MSLCAIDGQQRPRPPAMAASHSLRRDVPSRAGRAFFWSCTGQQHFRCAIQTALGLAGGSRGSDQVPEVVVVLPAGEQASGGVGSAVIPL